VERKLVPDDPEADGHLGAHLYVSALYAVTTVFSNFVPISLLLTLEIVKLCQGIFIGWDATMFDEN
jgi:magnesium-transporting ATPase (P-type)